MTAPRENSRSLQRQLSATSRSDQLLTNIRKQFAHTEFDASGRRRIFFDNAAGSLVLERAVEAEAMARRHYFPNIGEASWESKMNENTIVEGRRAVADFLNASSEDCIISGESATSLLFHLSYALSKMMAESENIVTTEYEHYANLSPWLELERRGVIKGVRFTKFNPDDGALDLEHFESLLDNKTRVVTVAGVSNGLGSKTHIAKIFKLAREVGAYTVLDAVHTTPHVPIDVQELQCDFVVFSAYKLFSRRGSFMYGRKDLLEKLSPYRVDLAPNHVPQKWEMGTRDQALFASISAVMDYLSWLGSEVQNDVSEKIEKYEGKRRLLKAALFWIEKYEEGLSSALLNGTSDVPGISALKEVEIYGLSDPQKVHLRAPTFSFNVRGAEAKKVAEYIWNRHAVAVYPDDFYSRALKTYGVSVAVRASLLHFNTVNEIQQFLRGLVDTVKHFNTM